ncbi:MAG: C39 family peptidase [Anaerolineae bacterium]
MRILVVPERLRQNAAVLRQAGAEWRAQAARLRSMYQALDWEARSAANVEGQVEQSLRLAESLAQKAEAQAAFLESAAARFEQADGQGAAVLGASIAAPLNALQQALPPWLSLQTAGLSAWQGLLRLLGLPAQGAAALPVSGGGTAVFTLATLASLPLLGPALQPLLDALWSWLRGDLQPVISPLPEEDSALKLGSVKLEAAPRVIQRLRIEDASPASSSGQVIQTIHIPEAPSYGHAVPLVSQHGLKYGQNNTEYGCTAASTEMVLRYWNQKDAKHKVMSAQEILNLNVKQGTFKEGAGLSVTNVHDELESLGYKAEDHVKADFESLKKDVEQGPVVAIVNLGMGSKGYPHAVVVTGISADGSKVLVNDPWTGKSHEYSADTFKASWGSRDNSYMTIRP